MEWRYSVVTSLTTIASAPCLVKGVYVNASPTSNASVSDGGTRVAIIPSGAAIGNAYDFDTTRFETSLVANPGGGDLTIFYKLMRDPHF